MKITKDHLLILWYEDEDGNKHYKPDEKTGFIEAPNETYIMHSRFPTMLTENMHRKVIQSEVDACNHESRYIKNTFGWIDGIKGRECMKCHGTQTVSETKYPNDTWPDEWEACGSRNIMTANSSWSQDLALAIANSGDYNLSEAILIAANNCERCMNALAHKYGLDWGYKELSKEWIETNTICEMCAYLEDDPIVKHKRILFKNFRWNYIPKYKRRLIFKSFGYNYSPGMAYCSREPGLDEIEGD